MQYLDAISKMTGGDEGGNICLIIHSILIEHLIYGMDRMKWTGQMEWKPQSQKMNQIDHMAHSFV